MGIASAEGARTAVVWGLPHLPLGLAPSLVPAEVAGVVVAATEDAWG